jgi:hypothetical protein
LARSVGRVRACAILLSAFSLVAQDWPFYSGDQASTKYSRLDRIRRANVRNLQIAWEWKTGEAPLKGFGTSPGVFEVTPLTIGGRLYLGTPYNRVVALDPETGRQIWAYDPKAYEDGQVPNGTGFVHRGVALWRDGSNGRLRVFLNSRYHLIALDAETGKTGREFRGQRHRQPGAWSRLGDQSEALHQHVASRDLQRSGNRRERSGRQAGVQERPAVSASANRVSIYEPLGRLNITRRSWLRRMLKSRSTVDSGAVLISWPVVT